MNLLFWFRPSDPAPTTPEAIALVIVDALAPDIRDAMMLGAPLKEIRPALERAHGRAWQARGPLVYRETVRLLERLGPMAFLTPHGWEVEGLTSLNPSRRKRR